MKKNFFTGLAILLPVIITFWLVDFLVRILTEPFMGITALLLDHYGFQFFSVETQVFISRFVILLFLSIIIFITGFLGRLFFINYFIMLGDALFHRIPVIRKIYKATQEIVKSIFGSEQSAFAQVVLVPFPTPSAYSIGMLTSSKVPKESDAIHQNKISVFVPGTPNPTMGFMLLFEKSEVIPLDMSVENAIKFIVSCGVMEIPFNPKTERAE